MQAEKKNKWKKYVIAWLLMTVIFAGLYHNFLFGGEVYAYSDIGGDTVNQYLPGMEYEIEHLQRGDAVGYDLQNGLGRYDGGMIAKYLNPVNWPLLLFGEENLPAGLLASTYLKYVVICLFAMLFFLQLFQNDAAAVACSLLWTFSGYNVLWGQHYNFLTTIAAFTVAMCGFQLFLDEKRNQFLVIPAVAYLAMTSYYFLYISCFFFLIYGVLYLAFRKRSALQIAKKAGWFVLVMVLAVCIAGVYLLPAAQTFLESARTAQVRAGAADAIWYDAPTLLGFLARFLSSNLIGVGNSFLGSGNYYECAILSVSLLSLLSLAYLCLRGYWKQVLGITVGGVLLLCMPMTSRILVFSTENQRWSYLLCFAQVIAIGFALTDILQNRQTLPVRRQFLRAILISDVLWAVCAAVMIWYDFYTGQWLNFWACAVLVVVAGIYHVAYLLMYQTKRGVPALMAAIVLELILCNYATVNDRQTIPIEQWESGLYHDGTEQTVDWLQEQDDSLYRVNKTYISGYYTDSLVQGYNGMGTYSSTNSASLLELAHRYGYADARNWFVFRGTDLLTNTMLGVKYVIAENGTPMDPSYYEQVNDDGARTVYENKYWMGFGYLYPENMERTEYRVGTGLEQLMALSKTYYETDTAEPAAGAEEGTMTVDLLPMLTGYYQCEGAWDGTELRLTGSEGDMLLFFDVPQIDEGWTVSGIRVEMTARSDSRLSLYAATQTSSYTLDYFDYRSYEPGRGTYTMNNTRQEEITGLRLDVSQVPQDVTIHTLELVLVDEKQLTQNLQKMQENCVVDFVQEDDSFLATVCNSTGDTGMLCIPLIYSDHWRGTVDGEPVEVVNINGGLVGVPLKEGSHEVCLTYCDSAFQVGAAVSGMGVLLCVAAWLPYRKHWRKKTNNPRR